MDPSRTNLESTFGNIPAHARQPPVITAATLATTSSSIQTKVMLIRVLAMAELETWKVVSNRDTVDKGLYHEKN